MTTDAQPGADAASAAFVLTDETFAIRKEAADRLLSFLERTDAMLMRCEAAMRDKRPDQFTAANSAARLMKAGTDVTKALMIATFGETRHRTFHEEWESPPQFKARSQVGEDLDAISTSLVRELREVTEESTAEWREEREKHAKWLADVQRDKERYAPQPALPSVPEASDDPATP